MRLWIRLLPLSLGIALSSAIVWLWPDEQAPNLAWLNILLLAILTLTLIIYGIKLILQKGEFRPGSRLRAKLVIGLVGMLLIPAGTLQYTANQMVEKGMDVWFDVRVDTLLDRALNLAQGFYSRIDHELQYGLSNTMQDDLLQSYISQLPSSHSLLLGHMSDILHRENWQSLQLYDLNERLIAIVQSQGLASLQAETFNEQARLALTLGRVTSELTSLNGDEVIAAYAPIRIQHRIVGLLKAKVSLPPGLVEHARAVEGDYRTYKDLERHRQSIRQTFTHTMLFVTLLIVLAVGIVAVGFSRRLTSPIGHLARALKEVTEGNLNTTILHAPDDDLGALVQSFNRMALHMKQNVEALEQAQLDLTDALSSSRQRQYVLETLLSNLQSGVLLLKNDGEIRLINQSLRQLLTLSPGEWVAGNNFNTLSRGKLQLFHDFYNELHMQEAESLQREIQISVDGNKRHLLARGARLNASGLAGFSGYLLLFDDVSQLAEAQRHRAWAEVAQRLAHEIKNPLTPIKLAAERLQRRFRKQVDDETVFDSCTHAIVGQVDRLQRLIADFSTLARLPQPHCKPTPCHTFLHEIRDLYSAYQHVQVTELPADLQNMQCYCDADQIRQVLINLMENALAATQDKQAEVRFYLSHNDKQVEFHIEDDGEGISPDSQAQMFEAYYSTKSDGSGLGLSIAKRIADEHQGALSLVSNAQPTHFCLTLLKEKPKKNSTAEHIQPHGENI